MTHPDPTLPPAPGEFDDVLGLLAPTELSMPATLTAPAPTVVNASAPPQASDLAAAIRRDVDEAWSLAVAFLGDEEAAWEALVDGFVRLGRAEKAGLALGDTLHAQGEALLEVARLLAKSGSLPEVRGAALPLETRLALLVQAGFPQTEFGAAQPAILRRALIAAYPQPGHARGEELCALLAHDVLGTLSEDDAATLATLRREHPTSAALIHARYLETVEVGLLVQPRVDELVQQAEGQLAREAERVEAVGALQLQTAVNCSYCHDRLRRAEAAFCSSCLAPHHTDCFTQHGQCSAPGCGETRLVQPREAGGSRRPRRWLPWIAAGLLGVGAAAWGGLEATGHGVLGFDSDEIESRGEVRIDPQLLRESQALTEAALAERQAREAERAEFKRRLEETRTDLNFDGVAILDCLVFLRDVSGLNLAISPEALELMEQEQTTVDLQLQQISLLNALNLVLSRNEALSYRLESEVVLVDAYDYGPNSALVLEVYAVADLVSGAAKARGGVQLDPDDLIEILDSRLSEDEAGSIQFSGGALVVRKSANAQAELRELLAHLRSGKSKPRGVPEWEQALRAALDRPIPKLEFQQRSLSEVAATLQSLSGCHVVPSVQVDSSMTINLLLRERPLRDVLTILCEQTGLAWRLRHGAIMLELPEEARESDCTFEIYDTSDLQVWLEADYLDETIRNATGEDAWDDPASLEVMGDHLFVFQTPDLQSAVVRVLAELRVSHAENQSERR